jgi:hypothetical protein
VHSARPQHPCHARRLILFSSSFFLRNLFFEPLASEWCLRTTATHASYLLLFASPPSLLSIISVEARRSSLRSLELHNAKTASLDYPVVGVYKLNPADAP